MSGFTGLGMRGIARSARRATERHPTGSIHFERLEDRRLMSTVVSLYGGNHGITQPNPGSSGISPPDLQASVGPSDLLQFTDARYTDLNLVSGVYTHTETPAQFWSRAGISNATPYDTRAIYDPMVSRFLVVSLSDANSQSNRILVAVSAGSQADQGWYSFSFPAASVQGGSQTYADNLTLGLDANGLYLATKNYVIGSGAYVNSSIYAAPISQLTQFGSSPTLSRWQAMYPSTGDWFQPAVNLSSNQTGSIEYIVAPAIINNWTYLEISSVSWSGLTPSYGGASLCATNGQYSPPPNGIQPAGYPQLDAGGEIRIQNAVVANGSIWTVFSANVGGNASGVFTQTSLSSITTCSQVGWLHQSGVDFLYPSIAVNAVGWVTLGATEVSPSIYPSAIVTGRRATDPVNSLAPIAVVEGGAVGYTGAFIPGSSTVVKWGEYSATLVDPTNNYTFWTVQEDSVSSSVANNWTTWFEEFGLTIGGAAPVSGSSPTIGPAATSSSTLPTVAITTQLKKDLLARALKHRAGARP